MKSYPYIGKTNLGSVVLFHGESAGRVIKHIGNIPNDRVYADWDEDLFTNITREYLQNTYGEVVSPEHAEFIIELAELHGFSVWRIRDDVKSASFTITDGTVRLFETELKYLDLSRLNKITIPLPPKVDKQELIEWPQVGDEVTWGKKSVKGEVKALSDGLAWIKNEYGNYCTEYASSLVKPKTPEEELREWMQERIGNGIANNFDCEQITHDLLHHLDIKKKPQ